MRDRCDRRTLVPHAQSRGAEGPESEKLHECAADSDHGLAVTIGVSDCPIANAIGLLQGASPVRDHGPKCQWVSQAQIQNVTCHGYGQDESHERGYAIGSDSSPRASQ